MNNDELETKFMWHWNIWGETFYSCDFCGSTEMKVDGMKAHIRKWHSDEKSTSV